MANWVKAMPLDQVKVCLVNMDFAVSIMVVETPGADDPCSVRCYVVGASNIAAPYLLFTGTEETCETFVQCLTAWVSM